jgi:WhiB family transcriptional regulator, redox-sensing transcriptional regulator
VSSPTVRRISIDIPPVRESIHKQQCGNILYAQMNSPRQNGALRTQLRSRRMDWRHKAICRDEDPEELFFPVGNSGPALAQIADAKVVCNRCPVTAECLSWALESGQDAGVWGGMSEDERRALKRRNARTRARTTV